MIRSQALLLALVATMTVATVSYGQDIVSASTLKRTYTINPTWPESAVGVEGWVMLQFTLLPNGTLSDIEVKESHPAGVFDASAVEALKQWKFEPVERDGKKVAQRAEIRMKYAQPRQ
jgi:TonB family protein